MKILKILILGLLLIHLTGCLYTVNNVRKLDNKDEQAYGVSLTGPIIDNFNKEGKFYWDYDYTYKGITGCGFSFFLQKYLSNNFDYGIIFYSAQRAIISSGGYLLYNLYKDNNYELNSIMEIELVNKTISPDIKIAMLKKNSEEIYFISNISYRYCLQSQIPFPGGGFIESDEFSRLTPAIGASYLFGNTEICLLISSEIYKIKNEKNINTTFNLNFGIKYIFSPTKKCCGCGWPG